MQLSNTALALTSVLEKYYNIISQELSQTGEPLTESMALLTTISVFLKHEFDGQDSQCTAIVWLLVAARHPSLAGYVLETLDQDLESNLAELADGIYQACENLSICGR